MSFYSPSDSQFTRHYREEVDMVFSAIDCVLHREHVIYCSSELSSGLALYAALRKYKLKTAADLRQHMPGEWTAIWDGNLKSAVLFAEAVRRSFHDQTIVITPAPFSAPDWSQPEYLFFWETLLRTRIKAVWFNRNWEFSNGCTFEFAVALDARLPTLDQHGGTLDRSAGIEAIKGSIQRLDSEGFDTSKLRENLELAQAVTMA